MKKIIINALLISGIMLNATEEKIKLAIPLSGEVLSQENGGILDAIDAYQDGVGIYTVAPVSGKIPDNQDFNTLVSKYGGEAKANNTTIAELVAEKGTSYDKAIVENIGNFEPIVPLSGTKCNDNDWYTINDQYVNGVCTGESLENTICNDNNVQTINDKYINRVCVGTNVEGQSCNDNQVQTINDKYINGVCVGTNVEGLPCNDNNPETIKDSYKNGVCQGVSVYSSAYSSQLLTHNVGGYAWGSIWANSSSIAGIDNVALNATSTDVFVMKTDKVVIVFSNFRDNPYTGTTSVGPNSFYINGENIYNSSDKLTRLKTLLGSESYIIHSWSATSQAIKFNKTFRVYKFKSNVLPLSEAIKIRL